MSKYEMLLSSSPPTGWRWQIMQEKKTVKSGAAIDENSARIAAKSAIRELERDD